MTDVLIFCSRKAIAFAYLLHGALAEDEPETWISWQDIQLVGNLDKPSMGQ